jgi:hypothetical protein
VCCSRQRKLAVWEVASPQPPASAGGYSVITLTGTILTHARCGIIHGMIVSGIRVEPLATAVSFTEDSLCVVLADGREVAVPLEWFPTLRNATEHERKDWRLIGRGIGIHWESIDEDISVESLLAS